MVNDRANFRSKFLLQAPDDRVISRTVPAVTARGKCRTWRFCAGVRASADHTNLHGTAECGGCSSGRDLLWLGAKCHVGYGIGSRCLDQQVIALEAPFTSLQQ